MTLSVPKQPAAAIAWLKARKKSASGATSSLTQIKAPDNLAQLLDRLANPRSDRDTSLRELEQAGVKVTVLGDESYSIDGPGGRMIFEGTQIVDENFANDPLGAMNISKAWRIIRSAKPTHIFRFPIDEGLLNQLANTDLEEPALIRALDPQRIDLPVLFLKESRGGFLVDGAHRVLANAMRGVTHVYGFIVTGDALRDIRVRVWTVDADGTKHEIDTTHGITVANF